MLGENFCDMLGLWQEFVVGAPGRGNRVNVFSNSFGYHFALG